MRFRLQLGAISLDADDLGVGCIADPALRVLRGADTSVTGAPDFDVAVTVTSSLTIDNTLSRVMIRSVADSTVEACCVGGRSTVTPSSPTSTHTRATTPTTMPPRIA